MGGKLAEIRGRAVSQVASATGKGLALAAREELAPVMDRLDAMLTELDRLPAQIEQASTNGAEVMRASLVPMVETVKGLRSSLETLPMMLAQQVDGIVHQINQEGIGLRNQITTLREGLGSLPDALAREVAPILTMAERLDEVLALQRDSLDTLHAESVRKIGQGVGPTLRKIQEGTTDLASAGKSLKTAMDGAKRLPGEIANASKDAVKDIKSAAENAVEEIRQVRTKWWMPIAQAAVGGLMVAAILGGLLVWLGILDSRRLQPSASATYEQAWRAMYQQQDARGRAWMDSVLRGVSGTN